MEENSFLRYLIRFALLFVMISGIAVSGFFYFGLILEIAAMNPGSISDPMILFCTFFLVAGTGIGIGNVMDIDEYLE